MKPAEALPSAGRAEIRIVAASPETARQVAEAIRRSFATTEQRSYPMRQRRRNPPPPHRGHHTPVPPRAILAGSRSDDRGQPTAGGRNLRHMPGGALCRCRAREGGSHGDTA